MLESSLTRALPREVVLQLEEGINLTDPLIYEHIPFSFCLFSVNRDHCIELCPTGNPVNKDSDLMVVQSSNPNVTSGGGAQC